jgi:hypothetical protein
LSKSVVKVLICSSIVGKGPFIRMTKSLDMAFLQIADQHTPQLRDLDTSDLSINSVTQCNPRALLRTDLKGPCRVIAGVGTTNNVVISSAADIVNGKLEGQLLVAVGTDVDEVGDSDSLSNGKTSEEGGSGELHVDVWVGSDRLIELLL